MSVHPNDSPEVRLRRFLKDTVAFKARLGFDIPPGYHYLGGEDYVLDRGSPFVSEALTPDESRFLRATIDQCPVSRWLMGHCYYNAQMLAATDNTRQLQYHEGWATGLAGLPTLHGWVVLNGKVIDMTWRTVNKTRREKYGDRILGVIPAGWAYYGAPFGTESVRIRIGRTRMASSFLDDVEHGFPLFQEPRLRSREEVTRDDS